MKIKTISIFAAFATLSMSANAATISILNMSAEDTLTQNSVAKTESGFDVTVSALVDGARTFSFTQTGDLDGGSIDDTLSFNLVYEAYTGSTFDGTDVTLGTASTPNVNNVNWHNNEFTSGNTLSLAVTDIVYTDGEGDETLSFDGFTAINPTNYSSAVAGDVDYYVGLLGATTITGDPTFTANLTSSGTGPLYFTASDGPVRLRNLDFQFETSPIPEPSSTALLGLGFAAFALRRRRV
ncbi:MAG: PEP-CTERM sorting domain-containing protein [Akkermansiaceae bacterium]